MQPYKTAEAALKKRVKFRMASVQFGDLLSQKAVLPLQAATPELVRTRFLGSPGPQAAHKLAPEAQLAMG